MRPERDAILFDLDDTLYRREVFVHSGFRAVAARLHQVAGVEAAAAFDVMMAAFNSAMRGRELQACLETFRLPEAFVPALVETMRSHTPAIELPAPSRAVLIELARDWHIGVVTNGPPDVQARKVAALGLAPLVGTVVYAAEHGSGIGKPDGEPFVEAARRLGVDAARAVFVGDDERCDIYGAGQAGMRTVLVRADAYTAMSAADAVVASIAEVPAAIRSLAARRRHVA